MDVSIAADKSMVDKLFADPSIKDKMAATKGDQSCLTVAVNRLQTKKIELSGSNGCKNKEIGVEPPPPAFEPTHKLRFPRYYGATDLVV